MSTDNGRVGGGARGATTDGSGTPGPGRDDHNGVVGKPETPTKLTKP
jgi:hypothetical protein